MRPHYDKAAPEAPAQAELRPTCDVRQSLGRSRVNNLRDFFALIHKGQ
jgi:hypothetical protein